MAALLRCQVEHAEVKENVQHITTTALWHCFGYNANNVHVVLLCQLKDGFSGWRLILMKLVQRGFYLPF